MFTIAGLFCFFVIFPIQIVSQTLSLQGNFVHNPTKSKQQRLPTLRECARVCMQNPKCRMFIYNTNNRFCQMAEALGANPTRELNKYEMAYMRGMKCAPDRRMVLRTRKMGKLFSHTIGHRYMPITPEGFSEMRKEDFMFCYAIDDVSACDLISFGSATGGIRLTTNSRLSGFVHYGFCAPRKDSCAARLRIHEYAMNQNFQYTDNISGKTTFRTEGQFLCYFWAQGPEQCAPGMNSKPFNYVFRIPF